MNKIKSGDEIIVITGKDKGKTGRVSKVLPNNKLVVDGINLVKKHTRPNPQLGIEGGIVEKEAAMQISNVAIYNAETGKGDRVGIKLEDDGTKVRVFKSNGKVIS